MINYKLLSQGVISFLVLILIGVFIWLWIGNGKNINPLPIMASNYSESAQDNEDTITAINLSLQAIDSIQTPLEDIITRFEYLYPKIKVTTRYVPTTLLLNLPDAKALTDQASPVIDIIIAENKISDDDLKALQSNSKDLSTAPIQSQGDIKNTLNIDEYNKTITVNDNEAWNITSFSYAIKAGKSSDGIILTANPAAITFRNFLLSSSGQDILERYGYDDIDGYKNSVDDLFNAKPRSEDSSSDGALNIKEALTNGQ